MDRLTSASGAYGTLAYEYDAVGNRTKKTLGTAITNYSYPTGNNRLSSLSGTEGASFSYDNNGNITSDGTLTYTYDLNNRLIQAAQSGTLKGQYVYDGLGRRVKKIAGSKTTYYLYDLTGKLIAEYDGTGAWQSDRVYLEGEPLARFNSITPKTLSGLPYDESACLSWAPVAGASYYIVYWGDTSGYYPNSSMDIISTSYCVDGLEPGRTWYFKVRAYGADDAFLDESAEGSGTLSAPISELPHYGYSAKIGGQADCGICHIPAGTFMSGFGVRTSNSLCLSCHSAVGVAHDRPSGGMKGHPVYVNVTVNAINKFPSLGSFTGFGSDNASAHLYKGRQVICMTCHNAKQKPHDVGRICEPTTTTDYITYKMQYGGWSADPYLKPIVYRDSSLWQGQGPTYSKDKKQYLVSESDYTFNPVDGSIAFKTAQAPLKYIYVTLYNPYLRNINPADNRMCLDCHVIETHRGKDCLECHGQHNTNNLYNIREKIRTNGLIKDVQFNTTTNMSGKKGVCVICHTITFYQNTTLTAPTHHDRENCANCHSHKQGFPSFTTVLKNFIRKLFAFAGFNDAYAAPAPLDTYSMGGSAFSEAVITNFTLTVTIVRNPKSVPSTATEALYYYHNDHLGTPMMMTDEAGNVVWKREQEPFGGTISVRGTVTENLRLPGQYYDAETEGNDNGFRTYDHKIGRYIEPDPIGQNGGINVYTYAQANPLKNIDPTGLMVFKCCRNTEINIVIDTASKMLGFKHCFIKTDTKEAGMGTADGGPLPPNPYHVPTKITNHAGQAASSHCEPYRDVDEDCVNRELEIGKSTGLWEFGNNCNTFVDNILRKCKKKSACNAFSNYSPPYSGSF